jgi:glycerate kinase
MISSELFATVLVAPSDFSASLRAADVAEAVAAGLGDAGRPARAFPVSDAAAAADPEFARALRAARAVVVGDGVLDAGTLRGRPAGEIAVRARQGGVPCHAIAGCDELDPFDRRILDLQAILVASDLGALRAAGRALGGLI